MPCVTKTVPGGGEEPQPPDGEGDFPMSKVLMAGGVVVGGIGAYKVAASGNNKGY